MNLLHPQPPPTPSTGDVWRSLLDAHPGHALTGDMEARRAFGIGKHGTPLQVGDARDAKADAYQEMLDGAVYAWARSLQLAGTEAALWRSLAREVLDLAGKMRGAP